MDDTGILVELIDTNTLHRHLMQEAEERQLILQNNLSVLKY